MNKYLITFAVVLVVLLGAYYLIFTNPENQTSTTPTSTPESIKIGLMIPLTGEPPLLGVGESILASAQLAVKEINEAGGVNGRPVEVVFEDDQCSSEGGIAAITRLVVLRQATAILGSVCSEAMAAGSSVAQVAGVPTIIIGAGAADLTATGEFIFRIYPADLAQARAAAAHLSQSLKKAKAAVLAVDSAWGKMMADVFTARFTELGGKVIFNQSVATDIKDASKVAAKIKLLKPDMIYLPLPAPTGVTVMKSLAEYKVRAEVFGTYLWDVPLVATAKDANGNNYFVPKSVGADDLATKIKTVTGKEASIYSPFVYDSLKFLADVMKQAGTDKKSIRTGLVSVSYDKGYSAPIVEFDDKRELKNVVLDVKHIADGVASIVGLETTVTSTPAATATSTPVQ